MDKVLKKLAVVVVTGAFLLGACAGGDYSQEQEQGDGFDASICKNIPVGVEALAATDPEGKEFKISCADLERCTSIMGWDAPPDVPCTGP